MKVVYGVEGTFSDVSNSVWETAFVIEKKNGNGSGYRHEWSYHTIPHNSISI